MTREPSCSLNHDAMQRHLRNTGQLAAPCPECGRVLPSARFDSDESAIRELIRQELVSYGLIDGCAEDE